jgi:hypothetical protein
MVEPLEMKRVVQLKAALSPLVVLGLQPRRILALYSWDA